MASILVIDDETQTREMLKEMLKREGYEVIDAPDGEAGVKLYREKQTDLIITDIIMPEKEGIEIIMELRGDFPDVKIIAISGGGRSEPADYLNMAKRLGAERTFKKPFDRKEFLGAVRELLEM